MDTKEKNRTGDPRRQSRSNPQRSPNSQRRSQSQQSRQRPQRAEEPERRTAPQRRPGSAEQKQAPNPQRRRREPERASRNEQQRRRSAPEAAGRRAKNARQVTTDAPEQVFRPAQEPIQARENSKPRDPQEAKRAAQRRQSAKRTKEREIQKQKEAKRPAVEYTQPKPVNVNRLLLQIAVVLALVLAVVLGLSVFFKVESVMVYGNSAYSAWTVQEAAGIEVGENLMTLNRTRASGKIIASLPYVESARIGIKLPDTVNIYIEEIDVAYAVQSEDGTWWLMTSAGNVVDQIDAGTASKHTKIRGVELSDPEIGKPAVAVEKTTVDIEPEPTEAPTQPPESLPEGETHPPVETEPYREVLVVTGQDRLRAALTILASLELNQIIGEASSVDVSEIDNLQLRYGQQYEVRLGDTSNMDYKISAMKSAIAQQKDYDMGILDVSFTQWPNQVGFTPAESAA